MRILKGLTGQVIVWVATLMFVLGPFLGAMAEGTDGPASSRGGKGTLYKVPEPRGRTLRGIDWRPHTDQAYIVGQGAIYQYNATTKVLTQIDGSESTDHYYEDIAWRPQGDYAIIVGSTPITTRSKGLVSKMWWESGTWRISAITAAYKLPLSDVAWAPDGSYAVIVGGARGGEDTAVGTAIIRLSTSDTLSDVYTDAGPSGLSGVSYNAFLGRFYLVGLDGHMFTYDGDKVVDMTDPALKTADMFGISWRDNGGRAIIAGQFSNTQKGYIITTDGTYDRILYEDLSMGYLYDACWAPNSDYTLLVGQGGGIYEYMVTNAKPAKINSVDSKHYYGVEFNDNGTWALIVGSEGDILRYDVTYPAKQNFPPVVYIVAPHDNEAFDYLKRNIFFSSNSTHDDDLDTMYFKWSDSIDGILTSQPYFFKQLTTGRHTITLEVDDNAGHVSKAYINVTIRPPKDPPKIDAGPFKIGYVGQDVALNGRIVNKTADIKTYEWNCDGDGLWRTTDTPSTTCRYGEVGKYNATFRVTDVRLAVATATALVSVFPKLSDADKLVNITSKSPLHPGEYLVFYVNASVAKSAEIFLVDSKAKEYQVGPAPMPNGTYYVTMPIPKDYRAGFYKIKWRYHDQNDTKTDWYVTSDRFEVKKYKSDGTQNLLLMIAAAVVIIVLVVVAVIVVVLYVLKRSVTKMEAAVLFYRDGRVMFSYVPPSAEPKPGTSPPAMTPPATPPPAQEPPAQQPYGATQPSAAPAPPQYTSQPVAQYQPEVQQQYQGAYQTTVTAQPQGPPLAPPPGQYQQPAYPPTATMQPQGPPSVPAPGQYQQPVYAPQPVEQPQPAYSPQPVEQPQPAPQPTTPAPAPAAPPSSGLDQAKAVVQEAIEGIRAGTVSKLPDKVIQGMRTIVVEQGQHTILAVSVTGPEPQELKKGMKNALQEIEILYGNQLRNWDGLTHDMPRLQPIIEKEIKSRQ